MKAWRRSGGLGLAASGPLVTAIDTDGSEIVVVRFSADVTLSAPGVSTLVIDGFPGSWTGQLDPDALLWLDDGANTHHNGEAWAMSGPEPLLAPAPALPQSGVTA